MEANEASAGAGTFASNVRISVLLLLIILTSVAIYFRFPDIEVRKKAVKWIRGMPIDELVDYLPQLVVALRHETYEDSPLACFLLDRALRSPRVAHHLFWLLCQNLPGSMPQVYIRFILRA